LNSNQTVNKIANKGYLMSHCVSKNNYHYDSRDSASTNTGNHNVTYTFKLLLKLKFANDCFHAGIRDMITKWDKCINTNSD